MTGVQLRPMTSADLPVVLDLEQSLYGDEAWSRQMLTGELSQQPGSRYYLIADSAGDIAGYAGLMAAGHQADVVTISVADGRWGQGIGSTLLGALLTEAARRGCTEVFLEVRADNSRAQRLYHWWGFGEIGVRRGYYQPSGTDAIVMQRDLTSGPSPAELAGAGRDGAAGPARAAGEEEQAR
jgi:[ribosomal protein S18]-alanine N-acetyltransferase